MSAPTSFRAGAGGINMASTGTGAQGDPAYQHVINAPVAAGGCGMARIAAAGSVNATNVKATPGQIYGWFFVNVSAALRFVKLYDKATAPSEADTPAFTIPLPIGGGTNVPWPNGIEFANGIGYRITTGVADADTGATTADDVHGVLLYR